MVCVLFDISIEFILALKRYCISLINYQHQQNIVDINSFYRVIDESYVDIIAKVQNFC
jgi:hypothetical protein